LQLDAVTTVLIFDVHQITHNPTTAPMKKTICALAIALLFGCASSPNNTITGKWLMHKVIQNKQDVTDEHDPHNERFLVLNPDSSFESGGRPFGANTGKYSFNASENQLFLDSDTGPEDDSYWKVNISNDTMYWQGVGTAWAEDFQIIQTRARN